MKIAFVVLPNNLFKDTGPLTACSKTFLVEEFLYFRLYKFHKQKLLFHRASMKAYEQYLIDSGIALSYIDSTQSIADIRQLVPALAAEDFSTIRMYDPCDEWLQKRLEKSCRSAGISLELLENPLFINTSEQLQHYRRQVKKYFQTDFYIHQRKTRDILVDELLNPLQGKWSFDAENRAKYPAKKRPPAFNEKFNNDFHEEASAYVNRHFNTNYGIIDPDYFYPINFQQAERAYNNFLEFRFAEFGLYEDAIVEHETHLHHSILSPLINTGLLLPMEVIRKAIDFAQANAIPFNSLEGFVRQILGWREFIRMIYVAEGNRQRTRNYWQFSRKIPHSFYEGTTGIVPIDSTIRKLNRSAYNHHIERLMILSNFMLLCEFDPNEVYQWFMEMYIDAYDWVMVPNVYGMGQFADGGMMCTKPYISGSNYLSKMSDYRKSEPWADIWDALFWRFMHVHRDFFIRNPRLNMLVKTFDKWPADKRNDLLNRAERFLTTLDQ